MALQSRLYALSSNVRVVLTPLWQRAWSGDGRSNFHVADSGERLSVTIRSFTGLRTFCTGQDLSTKKCVPCNSKDLRPMNDDAAKILLEKIPGWNLVNEDGIQKLHHSWRVKTFMKGIEFLQLVADVAEAEGHHPDLHLVGWNNVKIDIWTHAVGGLTENDFILASKINGLNLHPLLRIKPTNSRVVSLRVEESGAFMLRGYLVMALKAVTQLLLKEKARRLQKSQQ